MVSGGPKNSAVSAKTRTNKGIITSTQQKANEGRSVPCSCFLNDGPICPSEAIKGRASTNGVIFLLHVHAKASTASNKNSDTDIELSLTPKFFLNQTLNPLPYLASTVEGIMKA